MLLLSESSFVFWFERARQRRSCTAVKLGAPDVCGGLCCWLPCALRSARPESALRRRARRRRWCALVWLVSEYFFVFWLKRVQRHVPPMAQVRPPGVPFF